ncbi:MAG: alpha/beta hydrolase family protein [Phycisphaerales bacterium JB039]
MLERFSRLPRALAERARTVQLGGEVPALVAHPDADWGFPAPVVVWMHGRTAHKELDAGRYLRWIRAGVGACAIDLPGHGERAIPGWDRPEHTLDVLSQAMTEIDAVVTELVRGEFAGAFDGARLGVGGMSAGGMAALRRLCDPHPFRCAAVEATTGALALMYRSEDRPWAVRHDPDRIDELDPMRHLESFEPLPLLAMHSRADQLVPWSAQEAFLDALAGHYRDEGADAGLIEVVTWPETGAEREHMGFGRQSNESKNIQTDFLQRRLKS